MIQLLLPAATSLRPADPQGALPGDVLWIDLLDPDRAAEARVEEFLGINIPTHEEMREIEESSRLYREGEALYMTVRVLFGVDTGRPRTRAITFVLTPRCLVTVRYVDPHAFKNFADRFTKDHAAPVTTGAEVFVELLERIVDRTADVIEAVEGDLEHISDAVFLDGLPDGASPPGPTLPNLPDRRWPQGKLGKPSGCPRRWTSSCYSSGSDGTTRSAHASARVSCPSPDSCRFSAGRMRRCPTRCASGWKRWSAM